MYAAPRGMNNALSEGATDGKYKKIIQDRDGVVEQTTYDSRADLNDNWYGLHEKKIKNAPDGLLHATPNYTNNPVLQGVDTF